MQIERLSLQEAPRRRPAQKFLRGDKVYLSKEDPGICLQRDLFDFVLRA